MFTRETYKHAAWATLSVVSSAILIHVAYKSAREDYENHCKKETTE